jgi:hypothetical protein
VRQYRSLVRLFWQQLIRRKSLWIVVALAGVVLLMNFMVASQMKVMLEQGIRYDIATRKAAAALDSYAAQIRQWSVVLVLVVGALVAPPSRRDGTTQFVLTLSVSRRRLALAQFGALGLFIIVGTLVVHAGFAAAAYRLGVLQVREASISWLFLFVPLLLWATTSFSLSLTRPALLVYAVLLGIPYLLLPLLSAFIGSWTTKVPEIVRLAASRIVDNWGLLYPEVATFIIWPRASSTTPARPPWPAWPLETMHVLAAIAFWVVIGLWMYRRHDFGSRTPTK